MLFSCFTVFSVFANSSESSVVLECTSHAPVINEELEANFATCIPVKLSCWPSSVITCFDSSYSGWEIAQLVKEMERVYCEDAGGPEN